LTGQYAGIVASYYMLQTSSASTSRAYNADKQNIHKNKIKHTAHTRYSVTNRTLMPRYSHTTYKRGAECRQWTWIKYG